MSRQRSLIYPSASTRANSSPWTPPARQALSFPSNISGADTSAPYVALRKVNPHLDGLPIWGPGGAGVTVLRRIKTRAQTGYYAQLWWSAGNGQFLWDGGGANSYWGFHPYPQDQNNQGTTHWWEIASGTGQDFYTNDAGNAITMSHGSWLVQALVVKRNGDSTKTITGYFNLPDVTNNTKITVNLAAGYGEVNPPTPTLTIGDSPWFALYQHERASCEHGQIKIIAAALSQADVLAEAANWDALVTSAAQASIWWGKRGFLSADDLTCDFGTGRALEWASAGNKAGLSSLT